MCSCLFKSTTDKMTWLGEKDNQIPRKKNGRMVAATDEGKGNRCTAHQVDSLILFVNEKALEIS